MNTKLLNEIRESLNIDVFDIEYEAEMVQARIISALLTVIEDKKLTQKDLEKLTGLSQPFISSLFNNKKKLNVEHIALFQNALKIVFQPPKYLSLEEHKNKYYNVDEYYDVNLVPHQQNYLSNFNLDAFLKSENMYKEDYSSTANFQSIKNEKFEYAY